MKFSNLRTVAKCLKNPLRIQSQNLSVCLSVLQQEEADEDLVQLQVNEEDRCRFHRSVNLRPKKRNCLFPVTVRKKIG